MKNKDNRIVWPIQLQKPFLGISGLPERITSIVILADKLDEPLRVQVEFYPSETQVDELTQSLKIITEEYELVKKGTYELK